MIKIETVIVIIALVIAFVSGRYSVSQTTTTTKETVKQDDKINTNQDTKTITTTEKDPNGVEKTTTVTETVVHETQDDTTNTSLQQTTTVATHRKVNVSILAASNTANLLQPLSYGASITAEVLGPITVSVFGLSNGTVGAGLGLDF